MKQIVLIFIIIISSRNLIARCDSESALNLFYINGISLTERETENEFLSILTLINRKNIAIPFPINQKASALI